ncbi:MAG: SRPBCC family protein [Pseudomonadota bacterium]
MLDDFEKHLDGVDRKVVALERDGAEARSVILSRAYATTVEDLWDAVTNKERLPRWFAPVEGDLRPGGEYKVQGNAGGTITACEPPRSFSLTWEMMGDVSWVDVSIAAEGIDTARLTLTHTAKVSSHYDQYGPGATGVGWELGLLGLALHMEDSSAEKVDEIAFAQSEGGKGFSRGSAERWGDAAIAAGEDADVARASATRTAAFFTGEADPS